MANENAESYEELQRQFAQHRQDSEQRQARMTAGLRAVAAATDELLRCADVDTVLRRAVELARAPLGVERCSIFVAEGDHMRGTYGTDRHGLTTDERTRVFPKGKPWMQRLRKLQPSDPKWTVVREPHEDWSGPQPLPLGEGWIAITPIQTLHQPIGVFCNDTAISGAPLDEALQDTVAVYCSLLANIVERKRAEEALRQACQDLERRVAARTAELESSNERLRREAADRERAQEARALAEAEHRTLLENIRDGVFRLDTQGHMVFVNDVIRQRLGKPLDWFRRHTYPDIVLPADRDRARAYFEAVLSGRAVAPCELAFRDRSGELLHVEIHAVRLVEGSRTVGLLGVGRDVTERKRTDEAMRASEELHRALLSASPDAVVVTDLDGRIADVSDRALDLHGAATRGELLGRSVYELIAPEDREKARRRFREAERQGVVVRGLELAFARADGRRFIGEVNAARVHDAGDRPRAFVGIVRDATERKQVEGALRESEERFRSVVENTVIGLYRTTPDGRILMANPALVRMLGYPSFEALATRDLEVEGYEPTYPRSAFKERVEREGAVIGLESAWERRDGTTLFIRESARAIRDPDGNTLYYEGTTEDITQRKRAEEALRLSEQQHRTTLDAMADAIHVADGDLRIVLVNATFRRWMENLGLRTDVVGQSVFDAYPFLPDTVRDEYRRVLDTGQPVFTEETSGVGNQTITTETRKIPVFEADRVVRVVTIVRDITEKRRMEQEMQRAEKLEALSLLAGGLGHDFGNILTGILGGLAVAKNLSRDPQKLADTLAQAEQAAVRAKRLTRQLLTFSRGGAPVMEPASIADLIRQTAAFALSGSNCRCRFSIPDDLWPVEADVGQLSQVVQNLVINADQAMPRGGTIEIRARNIPATPRDAHPTPGVGLVKIAIEDHGIGIPDHHLDKIFDPYFTTKDTGSGLGLAVSYAIVKSHGGSMHVSSHPGAGSTFRITLPASTKKPVPTADDDHDPATPSPDSRTGRILLMDDEAVVRKATRWLLSELGHEVEAAADGAEALERFERARDAGRPFDAVVLDLTIPGGMGGIECIARLRELDPHVKAIACSGYADQPVLARFRDLGFQAVVVKPYEIEELHAALQRLLTHEHAGPRRPLPRPPAP